MNETKTQKDKTPIEINRRSERTKKKKKKKDPSEHFHETRTGQLCQQRLAKAEYMSCCSVDKSFAFRKHHYPSAYLHEVFHPDPVKVEKNMVK